MISAMTTPTRDWRSWAALGVAAAGAAASLHWMLSQPAPSELPRDFLSPFVRMSFGAISKFPFAVVGLWFIALASLAASALGAFLALDALGVTARVRLAVSLACGGAAVAWFYLVEPYPIAGRPATDVPLGALFAADTAALILWFVSMWQLVCVWRSFPQPITQSDWERHIAAFLDRSRRQAAKGWRRWVYPRKLFDAQYLESLEGKDGLAKLIWYGNSARQRARGHSVVDSPWVAAVFTAFALVCAALLLQLRVEISGLAPGQRPRGLVAALGAMAPMFFVFLTGAVGAVLSYSYLDYHRRWGSDEDRRRIAWIYSAVFVSGTLFLAVFLGAFAIFILGVTFALERLGTSLDALLLLPVTIGAPLFGLACIAALVLSVVYRGDIDPTHGARRLTVWGLLGIAVAVLFVLLERAVAMKAVQMMSLSAEWGPLVAGALAAATIAPVRGATEKAVNGLVLRYLPVDSIATGKRRTSAIALCDLSGYTALSDVDQKKALLHAALLQQKAARVCAGRGGRVVKSMGDAVLMEFEQPAAACAAMTDLHAQVPSAAGELGLDGLPLHSGAHYGEIVVGPDGDVYGQTVNLAARLQGQARDGEIVVSEALAQAASLAPERLRSLGTRRLKNVKEPVACHQLLLDSSVGNPQPSAQREAIPR